jgi:hypothetical protein
MKNMADAMGKADLSASIANAKLQNLEFSPGSPYEHVVNPYGGESASGELQNLNFWDKAGNWITGAAGTVMKDTIRYTPGLGLLPGAKPLSHFAGKATTACLKNKTCQGAVEKDVGAGIALAYTIPKIVLQNLEFSPGSPYEHVVDPELQQLSYYPSGYSDGL